MSVKSYAKKSAASGKNYLEAMQLFSGELVQDTLGFNLLSQLLTQLAGVHLPSTPKNHALMANRLSPILLKHKIKSYNHYYKFLENRKPSLIEEFISALTTHTTQFFRENQQIDQFKALLKDYIKQKERQFNFELRIWCAACSTGQEAYTLAMAIRDIIPDTSKWTVKILATDIDFAALTQAANGNYTESEIASLPTNYRKLYLTTQGAANPPTYQFDARLQSIIRFAPHNLNDEFFPFKHPFDFIFCRNVLIYFNESSGEGVINRLEKHIVGGGYLMVGASETGYVRSNTLENVHPSIYKKKERKK